MKRASSPPAPQFPSLLDYWMLRLSTAHQLEYRDAKGKILVSFSFRKKPFDSDGVANLRLRLRARTSEVIRSGEAVRQVITDSSGGELFSAPVSPDAFARGSRLSKGANIVMTICNMHIPSGNTV